MRLGDILRQQGEVSVPELAQAERAQRGLGGRIGTNLIELGFIHPDRVALALAQQKGVPAARRKHFESADPNLLRVIPKYLVERHNAIPVAVATRFGRELVVAFLDPDDITAVEAVAEASGMRVRPSVAPEFYIIHYLEKLYGIPPRRFLRVAPDLRIVGGRVPEPPREYPRSLTEELGTLEPLMADSRKNLEQEVDDGWDLPEPTPAPTPAPPQSAPAPEAAPQRQAAAAEDAVATAEQPMMLTADHAIERMKSAESKDDIGDAIAGYLVMQFGGGVVFVAKKDQAVGWRGYAPGVNGSTIESIALPLDEPSPLRDARERRAPVQTAPADDTRPVLGPLWTLLGVAAPKEVVAAPVAIKDRVVNIVYAHAADGGALPEDASTSLMRVCAAAAAAYVELIQRQKR